MLISKFDLYKDEWLDLVFDDRNKEYGAYDLRRRYAGNMVRAMSITFITVAAVLGASVILQTVKPVYHVTVVDTHPDDLKQIIPPVKKIDPPKPPTQVKPQPVAPAVATIQDPPPVVVPDLQSVKPVTNDDTKGKAIGQTTTAGVKTGGNAPVDTPPGDGGATKPVGNELVPLSGLDFMPEPVGGAGAWSKFLNKNLRFPAIAQDEGASGRVIMSFVIEKDGSLTNITVERVAGHGFDEEATRVLKLAKAWKPGLQNGQPVRVRYQIPINFQAAE